VKVKPRTLTLEGKVKKGAGAGSVSIKRVSK
jgi:hypothetical protein